MKNPSSYLQLARFVKEEQIDIIHCHRNLALLFGYFSTRVLLRTSAHVLIINRGTTYPLPDPVTRRVFRSDGLDHIIAVSKAVKDVLVREEGISEEKISVIYGSYDASRFSPNIDSSGFRRELGLSDGVPLVVCVAAVDRRKGLEYFISAAHRVKKVFPEAKFCVVGNVDDREYYLRLLAERDKLGLGDSLLFTGHRKDVPTILAACSLSVCASVEGEGITGAIRESLAMKKPVVTTEVSGNSEIVIKGETGWVVPPSSGEKLAEAIIEALSNPDEAERRATKGYELVKRLCSPETRYRQVFNLYRKLLMEKRK